MVQYMWWSRNGEAKRKLNMRTTPQLWTRMTLPDVTAYYSALDYDIQHTKGLSNQNRRELSDKAMKVRKFLAARSPAPTPSWKKAAVQWNSPTAYNPIQNMQYQAEGAIAKKAKQAILNRVRYRSSPRIQSYRPRLF